MTMEGPKPQEASLPLHNHKLLRRTTLNRLFMAVHTVGILALLYHHIHTLLFTPSSITLSLLLLFSDLVLAFNWGCAQAFHFRPIRRQELLHNLEKVVEERDLPPLDIFICTADPHKEPPIGTVNTALSVMAYDYPPDKVSVYVSDDGGAQVTLFAFMEAAKFARHWLPFCRENNVVERCPEAYFSSRTFYSSSTSAEASELKTLYESMKATIEQSVERGKPLEERIEDEELRKAFAKWTPNFTRQNHPPIIQVLVTSVKDRDVTSAIMPNLIYVSREKNKVHPHRFKAGALNTLVRVSATMTNAPILLALDCDTYSNDPQTVKRALCYISDPEVRPGLAYIQFPQIFGGLNRGDIYFCEHKRLFIINPLGMDGLLGPNYLGANCFFRRRALFGGPSIFVEPEIPELNPTHTVQKPIGSDDVLKLAHHVAASNYEDQTEWGSKLGFRYGSLVEDFYTGYQLQCEGWISIFCCPERPAFLGDAPMTLIDLLGQGRRWTIGLLEVVFCKRNTLTFGLPRLGQLALAYSHYAFWPMYCIPLTLYAFLPQLALLHGVSIFPKVTDPWFMLYIFLCLGANGKDLLDFLLEKGTFERWWNAQRMWMISGVTCFLFGFLEYTLTSLGIGVAGFNVTSKVQDHELKKRYDQGVFEFGVASPMFVTLTMAAIINLVSFVMGFVWIIMKGMVNMEGLILQILLSGFVVVNSWPVYEAMIFRSDKGRMPTKTTLTAAFFVAFVYMIASIFLKM